MIKIKVIGKEKIKKAKDSLKQVKVNIPREIINIMNEFGDRVVKTSSKDYLSGPRPEKLGVITNRLKSSIRFTPAKIIANKIAITVGTDVPYARRHEFGINIKKRSFLKPAVTDNMDWLTSNLVKRINKKLRAKLG